MATDLYPYARVGVDFNPTDTWDPTIAYGATGYDHRENDWIGALYPHVDASKGRQVLRGVKNTSASPIAANRAVMTEAGETNIDHVIVTAANTAAPRVRGITIAAIPVGHCGFVVCQGPVTGEAVSSDVTADTPLQTDAAGLVKDGTIGTHAIVGSSFATIDVSVLATGTVYIDVL